MAEVAFQAGGLPIRPSVSGRDSSAPRLKLASAFRGALSRAGVPVIDCGLCFDRTPGPLLAVVGCCGGAGASSLTYLLGAAAAIQSRAPVLSLDTGGPTAGLAVYAGVQSQRTLAEAADLLARGHELPGGLFALDRHGLRVIAGEPQFRAQGQEAGIRRVLADARAAHGLTVCDSGTLSREAERLALRQASHVAWLLPASESGLERARRMLMRVAPLQRELLIARCDASARKAPTNALMQLASERRAPLVLMPHIQDFGACPLPEVVQTAQVPLQALGGLLRR